MNKTQQAKVILKELDKVIQINWNIENYLTDAIVKGLQEIEKNKKH